MGCVSKGLATGWWLTWRASDGVIRGGICALHAMKASLSCSVAALAVGQTGTDALRTAGTGCTAPCCPRTGLTADSGCSSSAKHCGKRSFQEARGQVGTHALCPAPPSPKIPPCSLRCFSGCFSLDRQPCAPGTEGGESQSRGQPIFRLTISHSLACWVPMRWCRRAMLACLQHNPWSRKGAEI